MGEVEGEGGGVEGEWVDFCKSKYELLNEKSPAGLIRSLPTRSCTRGGICCGLFVLDVYLFFPTRVVCFTEPTTSVDACRW